MLEWRDAQTRAPRPSHQGKGYRMWVLPGYVSPSPGSGCALATLSPRGEEIAGRAAALFSPAGRRWPSRARPDEGEVIHMRLPYRCGGG